MSNSERIKRQVRVFYSSTLSDDEEQKSDEKHKFLSSKIKSLKGTNEKLQEEIFIRDTQITSLKTELSSLNDIINSQHGDQLGKGSTIATSKIMELSKKNRMLNAELETTKTKNINLESKLLKIELENKEKLNKLDSEINKTKTTCIASPTDVELLTSKLNANKQKLFDTLNQNNQLKNDLKLAQKCLQQEVGENFNLSTLATTNSNWRGRSQQILALQLKLTELKNSIGSKNLAKGQADNTKRIECEQVIKELTEALTNAKQTIKEHTNKIATLKIRNKNLSDEICSTKLKTLDLLDKSQHDDDYIKALNEEISLIKNNHEIHNSNMLKQIQNIEKEKKNYVVENTKILISVENIYDSLKEKQNEIDKLNETVINLENDLKSICGDFLFSCRSLKKSEFMSLLSALEMEKDSLCKQLVDVQIHLSSERDTLATTQEALCKHKSRCAKSEAKLKQLMQEIEFSKSKNKRVHRVMEYSRMSSIKSDIEHLTSPSEQSSNIIELEDLKNQLEFSNERIKFLEEKVQEISIEKENDSKQFVDIMHKSKYLLLKLIQEGKEVETPTNCDEEY